MAKTGRQPYTTRDVQPFGLPGRLRPPRSLGELEKRAFIDLICAVPSTQFRPSDLPLLCRWAELNVMAEQAAGELQAHGMVGTDGKPSAWFTVYHQSVKALSLLAMRLHLAPQSRGHAAPKTQPGPVSYYDRLTIEAADGDAQQS